MIDITPYEREILGGGKTVIVEPLFRLGLQRRQRLFHGHGDNFRRLRSG